MAARSARVRALARWFPHDARASGCPRPLSARVSLSGDLDERHCRNAARRLRTALRSAPAVLEIDLGGARVVTTAGRSLLFGTVDAARAAGIAVVITNAPPPVRSAMRTAGLDRVLRHAGRRDG
ncbi:STAS domain-containing protein [Kitasatospora sp. NPDC052896]|uniref:STAS domain-containing protein n=1 Tax=Kitasatospora sp. NPDC052896 TaxID=3364061 RepID=UPI0037C779A5